jgi:heme/copper-type cytochrome/quinol oxidase subunit 1
VDGTLGKVMAWYDNEWGFTHQMVREAQRILVFATIAIAGLSMTVWAHHMFATGAVLLPFFAFMSYLIAVPTGIKFFNWIGTMWRGSLSFETPMLWAWDSWSRSCSVG